MKASENAYNLITAFEGFSSVPYVCPSGKLTIGWGHIIRDGEKFSIPLSDYEAALLLEKDVEKAEKAVNRLITIPLEQHEFDALVSFTFNVGVLALQRSTLRQKLNRDEDREEVADEFLKWVYAGGRKLRGLVRRRIAERNLFLGIA